MIEEDAVLVGGPGRRHRHIKPWSAYDYRWNTVIRSRCGHLFVRRHSFGFLFPLSDHYPQFVRLRPWHLGALLRLALRRGAS